MSKKHLVGLLNSLNDPELDYMETLVDNAAAQAAYVTNATETTYVSQYPTEYSTTTVKTTTDLGAGYFGYLTANPTRPLTGGEVDNQWLAIAGVVTNQRFHIDLGSAKTIKRIYYENSHGNAANLLTNRGVQNFTFWGSNTAGDFTDLTYANNGNWVQITPTQSTFDRHSEADAADPKYITVTNTTAYRYYAFKFADNYGNDTYFGVRRIELQTSEAAPSLQSYSESTIKTQGSYSLKGVAVATDSLNKTLTRTIVSPIDCSATNHWKYDIRASRAGSNIKVSIHDTVGGWIDSTPTIATPDEFQTVDVDLSAVADANKSSIDQIEKTIVNADAANTFYIDNMFTILIAPTATGIDPDSGPIAGGTAVTITGTDFITGATVTIGGNPATDIEVINSTTITATTPAGSAGARDVVVTTSYGVGTLTDGFTYIAPPSTAAYRAQRGLISGYHCFNKQYIDFTKKGLAPLKLPDGTLW